LKCFLSYLVFGLVELAILETKGVGNLSSQRRDFQNTLDGVRLWFIVGGVGIYLLIVPLCWWFVEGFGVGCHKGFFLFQKQ